MKELKYATSPPTPKLSAAADTFELSPCGSVRNNSLGTEGWCAIFAALRDNKDNKIESWDVSDGGIDVETAKVLAEYVSASTALKSLKCAARMLPCPALSAAADTFVPFPFAASPSTTSDPLAPNTSPRRSRSTPRSRSCGAPPAPSPS